MSLACALLAFFLVLGEMRRETWPDGSPRAEYEVVVRAGREVRSGPYRAWHANGALASEGTFAEDQETGRWKHYHPDGTRAAEGNFARGVRVGAWETYHPNGTRASRGRYEKGARTGEWSFWDEHGSVNALDSGVYEEVELRLADGRVLAGERVDGVAHGPWRCSWPEGAPMLAGTLVRGEPHGPWRFHRPDGTLVPLLSAHYEDGRRTGPLALDEPAEAGTTPSPQAGPAGWPDDAEELEKELATWLAADPRRLDELHRVHAQTRTQPGWLAAGPRVVPLVLRRLLACDPLADRDTILRLDARFLRPLSGGHALVALPKGAPPGVEDARAYQDAWASLWAATRDDAWFWHVELPLTPVREPDEILRTRPVRRFLAALAPPRVRPAVYAQRFAERDERAEAPLHAALAWLEANQLPDGRWSASVGLKKTRYPHDVGVTSLALLALLGAGRTPADTPALAAGLGWLLAQQSPETGEFPAQRVLHDWIYEHLLATLAVGEVQALFPSELLLPRLQQAVDVVLDARNPGSGWRYDLPPSGDVDTSVTAWAVAVLYVARELGVAGDFEAAFAGARAWLDEVTDDELGRTGYDQAFSLSSRTPENERFPRELGEAMTGAGLFARRLLGAAPDDPLVKKQLVLLAAKPPRWDPKALAVDEYYFFWGAQAVALCGALERTGWDDGLSALARGQSGNAAIRGSWDPVGVWSHACGRAGTTALLALALEAPFRYTLPDLAPAADEKGKRKR